MRESAVVGEQLCRLRDQGKAIVLVSHDLEFVYKCSDRIQIMRHGRVVGVRSTANADSSEVIELVTGLGTDKTPVGP